MNNYQSENIADLATALSMAQGEIQPAPKDGEAKISDKGDKVRRYASLTAVYSAIREILPKHGLSVAQTMLPSDDGKARVRTILMHKSGQWISGEITMPSDRQGGVQGIGSAISYARRYSLSAIIGVVSEDDDDGNAAQGKRGGRGPAARPESNGRGPSMISDAQSKNLRAVMSECITHVKNDREIILQVLSTIFSREITNTKELTSGEASTLISNPDTLIEFAPTEAEYKTILADRQALIAGCKNICADRKLPIDEMLAEMFPAIKKNVLTSKQWKDFRSSLLA